MPPCKSGQQNEVAKGKDVKSSVQRESAELPELTGSRVHVRFLSDLNEKVESGENMSTNEMKQVWHDFLWASDPEALLMEECGGLNAMHMRGLLLARSMGLEEMQEMREDDFAVLDLVPETDDVHVHDKPVNTLTAHELRDSIEAFQLHMGRLLERDGFEACEVALFRLFVRFGMLASGAYDESVMDDHAYMTRIPCDAATGVLYIYTCKALRTLINIFLVLFRAVEIVKRSCYLDVVQEDLGLEIMRGKITDKISERHVKAVAEMIKSFHVEATLDEFNILQQMFYLKPAQRLVYRHNFSGMFNDISQVTYFHYPSYVRMPQVNADEMRAHPMNSLACIGSVVPHLTTQFDDDGALPFGVTPNSKWSWVVSVGKVYLWDAKNRQLLKSRENSILDLTAFYLLVCHGVDFFQSGKEDAVGRRRKDGEKKG
eukprot:3049509-Rhodomonas_salina.1